MNKRADLLNGKILNEVVIPIVGKDTTYQNELEQAGHLLLPNFQGVFAADRLPELKNGFCCIVNLDKHDEAGSHWVGIYKVNGNKLVYDSFGRKTSKILPDMKGGVLDTEHDAEQDIKENNCGARSLAWLCLCHYWGDELAKLV